MFPTRNILLRPTDDSPEPRSIQPPGIGPVVVVPQVGGLHHRYERRPAMKHRLEVEGSNKTVEYQWQVGDQWCRLSAQTAGLPKHPQEGSLEQFITEHYWGYSTRRGNGSLEYHVSHIPWQVWATTEAGFEGEASVLYGRELSTILQRRPDCAFVADGSPVTVFTGHRVQ